MLLLFSELLSEILKEQDDEAYEPGDDLDLDLVTSSSSKRTPTAPVATKLPHPKQTSAPVNQPSHPNAGPISGPNVGPKSGPKPSSEGPIVGDPKFADLLQSMMSSGLEPEQMQVLFTALAASKASGPEKKTELIEQLSASMAALQKESKAESAVMSAGTSAGTSAGKSAGKSAVESASPVKPNIQAGKSTVHM